MEGPGIVGQAPRLPTSFLMIYGRDGCVKHQEEKFTVPYWRAINCLHERPGTAVILREEAFTSSYPFFERATLTFTIFNYATSPMVRVLSEKV
jgi:hypothetical protein